MMTITLPETVSQIKTLSRGPDVQTLTEENPGSIVFRLNVHGILGVEIITDQSNEEDTLRQRLKTARPVLGLLQRIFMVEQPSRIQ
jgi:hypothetical protein